jgi:O-antigen ligase
MNNYQVAIGSIVLVFPLFIVFGIAITEFFAFIMICYYLTLSKEDYSVFKTKEIIFLMIFALYVFINAYFQIYDNLKYSSFFYFRYILFSLSVYFLLNSIKENFKFEIFFKIFIFVTLVICFDAFYQFFIGKNLLGYQIIKGRISGFFDNDLILGSFLIKIFPSILFLYFISNIKFKYSTYFLILFFAIYFITIFLSASRTSIIFLFFYIFLVLLKFKELKKIFFTSAVILIFFIFLSGFYKLGKSDPFNFLFIKSFNQITNQLFTKTGSNYIEKKSDLITKGEIKKNILIFSKDHQGHYILSYELFLNNPFFGTGPKGFRYHCRKTNYSTTEKGGICSTHPHNILMQVLSELGIVGLIFYIIAITFLILKFV